MKKKLMLLICALTMSYLAHASEDPEFGFTMISRDSDTEEETAASPTNNMAASNGSSIIYYNPDKKMTNDVIVYDDYLNCPEMIKPQDINEKDGFGDTRLHRAIEGDKVDEIGRLLRNGARYDIPNDLSGKTALSLMMDNSSKQARDCFAEHGILFIPHADLCNNSLHSLLNNGGEVFNGLLLESIGSDGLQNMIDTLRVVFEKAWKHEAYSEQGTMSETNDTTCLAKVKIAQLHAKFGEPIISYTESIVAAYRKVNIFIEECTKKSYIQAKSLLSEYPQLHKALCFNKYIMTKLLIQKEDDCWELLLGAKFNPNVSLKLYGTILHGAAHALNPAALYYLAYYGAHYNATNAKGKNPVEVLVDNTKNQQYKEQAEKCLCIVSKALQDRMQLIQDSTECTDKENVLRSLIDMEDFIRRAMPNNSKNITQLY